MAIEFLQMSRRTLLRGGACIAAATGMLRLTDLQAATCLSADNEATVRKYYKLWETKDWHPFDVLLDEKFTFTSANDDDHISKSDFKKQCWDTQIDHIARFDLLQVMGSGNSAFVMYDGYTKDNHKFKNVEFVRVDNGKILSIDCYFGQKNSFASAVSAAQK